MRSNTILASILFALFASQQSAAQDAGQVVITDNTTQSTMGIVTTPEQLIFDESTEAQMWMLQCRYEKNSAGEFELRLYGSNTTSADLTCSATCEFPRGSVSISGALAASASSEIVGGARLQKSFPMSIQGASCS